ncbi:hypothetical protein EBR77_02025 [bacterium]|nr:hypothetical protein [bacterium]
MKMNRYLFITTYSFLLLTHVSVYTEEKKQIRLENAMLSVADANGMFDGKNILNILRVRKNIADLLTGVKSIGGIMLTTFVNNIKLSLYCQRPETVCGATFVVISKEHPNLTSFITSDQSAKVQQFLQKNIDKTVRQRLQGQRTYDAVFTGSYATHPITKEALPIYISDYALESYDLRTLHVRMGIPAHNPRDFAFAKHNNLPIKLVINAPDHLMVNGQKITIQTAQIDASGALVEPYLKEYKECFLLNSGQFTNLGIQEAHEKIIKYIEEQNMGFLCEDLLQYEYDGQMHSIRSLAHIQEYLEEHKHEIGPDTFAQKMGALQDILFYAQHDFLCLVDNFLHHVHSQKKLMSELITESCQKRNTPNSYMLRWSSYPDDIKENEIFEQDITSIKMLYAFCSDLVNFLTDLAHSCPHALASIKKQ